jgi:hypothetical protein
MARVFGPGKGVLNEIVLATGAVAVRFSIKIVYFLNMIKLVLIWLYAESGRKVHGFFGFIEFYSFFFNKLK